jgi:phosphoribosylformylglycinamidine synthase
MIGILEDKAHQTTLNFKNEKDLIYLIGESRNDISSSEYLYSFHKVKNSPAPYFDLEEEYKVQKSITSLIRKKLIASAHDLSDGGLFMSLLESAMSGKRGFEIKTDGKTRKDAFLFGEAQSRVLVSVTPDKQKTFEEELSKLKVSFNLLGTVKGDSVVIDGTDYGNVTDFQNEFDTAIEKYLS